MKKLFLDMDGVVADFNAGMCELHAGKLNTYAMGNERGDKAWDCIRHFDGTAEEFYAPMGYDFWRNLPLMKDAEEIVDRCVRDFFNPDQICFLTSPVRTAGCMEGKREWAYEHFPGIPLLFSVSCEGGHIPPKNLVAGRDSVLIDDNFTNIDRWEQNGGLGFLYPRRWNREWTCGEQGVFLLYSFLNKVAAVDKDGAPPLRSSHAVQAPS